MNEIVERYLQSNKNHLELLQRLPNMYRIEYEAGIIDMVKKIISFLEGDLYKENSSSDFFENFEFIDYELERLDYLPQEKLEIIAAVVKRNIELGILQPNMRTIETTEKYFIEDLARIIDRNGIIEGHRIMMAYYLEKQQFHQSDIQQIDEALMYLKINGNTRKEIKDYLIGKYQRQVRREEKKNLEKHAKSKDSYTGGKYSIKEYYDKQNERKQIIEELNKYFNYEKMEVIRPLSTLEKVHCVELLGLIGSSNEEKLKFLKMFESIPKVYKNSIVEFIDNYEKLKYYENSYGLQQYLKTIQDYLEFIFICDDEEYACWKDEIEHELNGVMKILPKTYEYELSRGKVKTK